MQVGSIRTTTSSSILKKNLGDASVSLCAWILVGYALANGEDAGRVAGGTYFAFWQGAKVKIWLQKKLPENHLGDSLLTGWDYGIRYRAVK